MTTSESAPLVQNVRRRQKGDKPAGPLKYEVTCRSGGRFGNLEPVFSKNEKYVFLCTRTKACVYATASGELVRTLVSKDASSGTIVSIFLHPSNEYRLITVSHKGRVLVWDWSDGSLLQKHYIEPSTEVVAALLIGSIFIWTDGKHISTMAEFPLPGEVHHVSRLSVCYGLSYNGHHVFAYGDKSVMSFRLHNGHLSTEHAHSTLPSSCTAFAVSEKTYAYADASGAIYVYAANHCGDGKDLTPRKLHWHASAVNSLAFALKGQYLLSGGSEGVLVLWQMNSSARQYLPRISHTIDTITVSPSSNVYILKLSDNSFKLLNATNLELRAEVVGIRQPEVDSSAVSQHDNLFLCTGTEVHVWNLQTARTSLRVPITSRTFAGQVRDDFHSKEAVVNACAVYGDWMATLDSWSTPKEESVELGYTQPQSETYLKFWKWCGTKYDLVTRIDSPHGIFRATQVIAAPNGTFFSIGDDAVVKVWKQKPTRSKTNPDTLTHHTMIWTCVRLYRMTRLIGPCKIALAPDGSVLALHTHDQTFLMDALTGRLRRAISGIMTGRVVDIGFVQHYLVILGLKCLVVWNLITESVAYALRIPEATTSLNLCCGDVSFVLGTNERTKHVKTNAKLFVFTPDSAKPIYREKCARSLSVSWTTTCGFIQVTEDLEIITIADSSRALPPSSSISTDPEERGPIGIAALYRPIGSPRLDILDTTDHQETILNTQLMTNTFESPLKSLEARFEDLALLVLGGPSPSLV